MENSISFRPLRWSDLPLLQRWLSEPHVVAWWRHPLDAPAIATTYGPRIDGREPSHVFVIEYRRRPIGWIQWYRWSDYPEHGLRLGAERNTAGIDLAIGEKEMTGIGIGPSAIRTFVEDIVFADPTITAVVSDPEQNNVRSVHAFKKAGFTVTNAVNLPGEPFARSVVRLSRG